MRFACMSIFICMCPRTDGQIEKETKADSDGEGRLQKTREAVGSGEVEGRVERARCVWVSVALETHGRWRGCMCGWWRRCPLSMTHACKAGLPERRPRKTRKKEKKRQRERKQEEAFCSVDRPSFPRLFFLSSSPSASDTEFLLGFGILFRDLLLFLCLCVFFFFRICISTSRRRVSFCQTMSTSTIRRNPTPWHTLSSPSFRSENKQKKKKTGRSGPSRYFLLVSSKTTAGTLLSSFLL